MTVFELTSGTLSTFIADTRAIGRVLGVPVDLVSCGFAAERVCDWAARRASRSVLVANVHMTMEAVDDPSFRELMERADLVVADGKPLVWALKMSGFGCARHVRGQDLVLEVCRQAAGRGLEVGLFGTTREVLEAASARLTEQFPGLRIVYTYAPPFGPLGPDEDVGVVTDCNASGARILLVSLGCPKQEKWMAAHSELIDAVMIGAGAAVDMLGGSQPVAPRWMQRCGLEWAFRLSSDPSRLWRRYARHNLRFLALAGSELLARRRRRPGPGARCGRA